MKKRSLHPIPYIVRSQRRGIILLAVTIVLLQTGYFVFINWRYSGFAEDPFDEEWRIQQLLLDSLAKNLEGTAAVLYPFNPNYISDYKGYLLGMSVDEIDRLHAFREKNLYVHTAREFQEITDVSDRWLDSISVYFKFPHWVSKQQDSRKKKQLTVAEEVLVLRDINSATQQDLMSVRGVGPVFSERILAERNRFGGFVDIKQLEFIWGLSAESLQNLKRNFDVLEKLSPVKTPVNTASLEEISMVPYLNYRIARTIVIYRSENGDFTDFKQFENIVNFPLDKLDIISLYLAF